MVQHRIFLFVEVPEGALDFQVYNIAEGPMIDFWVGAIGIHEKEIKLPIGYYEIIGLGHQLDNEQWNEIVDQVKQPLWVYWKDYVGKKLMTSPTASGFSLLASHNMKPSTTLILKKQ